MRTLIIAALAAIIGIGAANAAPTNNASTPTPQDSSADWVNG